MAHIAQAIYFDYAATTPVMPEVAETMQQYLTQDGIFANPAAAHRYGFEAQQAIDQATQTFAGHIGCVPEEVIWTSGATEANNLALKSATHITTMETEHPAVLDVCQYLETQDVPVTYLKPHADGRFDHSASVGVERSSTRGLNCVQPLQIISIMLVNNETGVIQDIPAIAKLAREQGALLHVDAAQALGKLPINVRELDVDLMSFSGHKNYGPKGIGALYVRKSVQPQIQPQIHGGGQQYGLRSGTLAAHLIAGMAKATQLTHENLALEAARQAELREQLWAGLNELPGVARHGAPEHLAPHILCISFESIPAQQLLEALPGLAISSGSACHSASLIGNHVLKSMGLNQVRAQNGLRFSLGRYTTADQIEQAIEQVKRAVEHLNKVQESLWELP